MASRGQSRQSAHLHGNWWNLWPPQGAYGSLMAKGNSAVMRHLMALQATSRRHSLGLSWQSGGIPLCTPTTAGGHAACGRFSNLEMLVCTNSHRAPSWQSHGCIMAAPYIEYGAPGHGRALAVPWRYHEKFVAAHGPSWYSMALRRV